MTERRVLEKREAALVRKRNARPVLTKVYVVCEGEKTEPLYVKALDAILQLRSKAVELEFVPVGCNTPRELLVEAKKHKAKLKRGNDFRKNDSLWVFFDRDEHPYVAESIAEAKTAGINVAFSSRCFEFWLLLHYESTTCLDPVEVAQRLKKHVPGYTKKGLNNSPELMKTIAKNWEQACTHAQRVREHQKQASPTGNEWDFHPYTGMDKFVDALRALQSPNQCTR